MALGRKSLVIIAGQVVSAMLGAVALAFIGRFVSPAQMGMVAYALGLAGLAGSFAQAGLNQAHIKKVHDHDALDACHGALFWLRSRISFVVFGVAAALFVAYHNWKGFQDTTITLILIALAYHFTLVMRGAFVASFDAWQQTARAQMVPLMDGLVRAPAVIAATSLLALGAITKPAYWVASTYLLGAAVGLWFAAKWFRAAGNHIGHSTPELRKQYLQFGIPLAISGIIAQWTLQLDVVMIGFFGTAADVGSYFAANRIIRMVIAFPLAIGVLLLPTFTRLNKQGAAGAESGRVVRQLAVFLVPCLLLLAMYPETVLRIAVGGRYANAAKALQWLALFAVLATLRIIPLTLAKARDQPKVALHAGFLNLGSNIILNAVLIPKSILGIQLAGLGIEGAAIATLASQAIGLTYISWTQRGHMQWNVGGVMLVSMASAFIWLQIPLAWFQAPSRIWELGTVSILFVATNWWIMRLSGILAAEEVQLAKDALSPRKFMEYVRSEFKFRPPS